jgi:hypothetical protein
MINADRCFSFARSNPETPETLCLDGGVARFGDRPRHFLDRSVDLLLKPTDRQRLDDYLSHARSGGSADAEFPMPGGRLILSRENSTPRCVMFHLRLAILEDHASRERNPRCSKTDSSAHHEKGMVCRVSTRSYFGGRSSPLLTHPEAVMDLRGSRASHFSHGSMRRPLPPEAGARFKVAPHWGHVGRWLCPTVAMCRRIHWPVHSKCKPCRRIIPLTCGSAMEGDSSQAT